MILASFMMANYYTHLLQSLGELPVGELKREANKSSKACASKAAYPQNMKECNGEMLN